MASNLAIARGAVPYVPPASLGFWRWTLVFLCTGPSMNPRMVGKKLNVHPLRDGTAAGRHGGAARENSIFS